MIYIFEIRTVTNHYNIISMQFLNYFVKILELYEDYFSETIDNTTKGKEVRENQNDALFRCRYFSLQVESVISKNT